MRIGLFIDTQNYGGAESVVLSLASFLVQVGQDPVIYQYENSDLQQASLKIGIECRQVPCWAAYKRTYRLPWFAHHLRRMLQTDGVDLLHSHLFGPVIAGGLASWFAGIPHIGTLHDVYIVQERPARARLLRLVHLLGTKLVCVSAEMAEYYRSVTNISATELSVIRNGVDLTRYGAGPRDRKSATETVNLAMVGRLDAIKRHDLLLETIARLKADPRWNVVIVGDGPEREALELSARRLGIESRVEFLGHRADVPELLAKADVFLLISDSEGMSLSLIEALASGLPVIATRVGNNAELVSDGWNGILIDPGSSSGLEVAVTSLVGDSALREKFGRNSLESARALGQETTMAAYLSLYRALGRPGAEPA